MGRPGPGLLACLGLTAAALAAGAGLTLASRPLWEGAGAWFEIPMLGAGWTLLAGLGALAFPQARKLVAERAPGLLLRLEAIALLSVLGGCVAGQLIGGGYGDSTLERWMDGPVPGALVFLAVGATGLVARGRLRPSAPARKAVLDRLALAFAAAAPLAFIVALADVERAQALTVPGVLGMMGTPVLAMLGIIFVAASGRGQHEGQAGTADDVMDAR